MFNSITKLSKKSPTDIFEACRSGDLAAVQKLADSIDSWMMQEPISLKYPHNIVIECGHLHILKWMIEASGKEIVWPDLFGLFGFRLDYCALNSANLDILTYLIESKPTGFDAGCGGNFILRNAIVNSRLDKVKLLFEVALKRGHSIDVNAFGIMYSVCYPFAGTLLAVGPIQNEIARYIINEVPIIAQQYPTFFGFEKSCKTRKGSLKNNLPAATGFTEKQIVARYEKIKRMFESGCDQDFIRKNLDKAVASTPQRVRQKVL